MQTQIKVLIIDDESAFRALGRITMMRYKGPATFIVSETSSAEDALVLLGEEATIPDIILLDLEMPQMNGIGFLHKYAQLSFGSKARPAVYILSAAASLYWQREYDSQEANIKEQVAGVFLKPLDEEHMNKMLSAFNVLISKR